MKSKRRPGDKWSKLNEREVQRQGTEQGMNKEPVDWRVCPWRLSLGWAWKLCSAQDGVMVFHLLGANEEGMIKCIPPLLVWSLFRVAPNSGWLLRQEIAKHTHLLPNFCLPIFSFRLECTTDCVYCHQFTVHICDQFKGSRCSPGSFSLSSDI